MKKFYTINLLIITFLLALSYNSSAAEKLVINVKNYAPGSPVLLGIPFPKGTLYSPDNVRLLNKDGVEILSQSNTVTTWKPADHSIKWLWVFFFTEESNEYYLEYGEDVRMTVFPEKPLIFKCNQRTNGFAEINTGNMLLRIQKGGSGFIDRLQFNKNMDGFDEDDMVLTGIPERGTFMDYLDDQGLDGSKAVIRQYFIERGSGPLHAILRIEGEYEFEQPGHENSPFVTYIHAYAGKSYVRVLHTITYTGVPDKSKPLNGKEHILLATQTDLIVDEDERAKDKGLLEPNDMIKSAGFGLNFNIKGEKVFNTALREGNWWEEGDPWYYSTKVTNQKELSVFQTGPNPIKSTDEFITSSKEERIGGFVARLKADKLVKETEKAEGWITISDSDKGVSMGLKNMFEEYPSELCLDLENEQMFAYSWSPKEKPMTFSRGSLKMDQGMVGNFAQGITKTTEMILYAHDGSETRENIESVMDLVLNPPVVYADPKVYINSGVYGKYATADNDHPDLERSMQYKFDWMLFNQNWEPWYGFYDYGDIRNYYFNYEWRTWSGNEPEIDYMWWMNFLRTGDPKYYKMAVAMSRHTMDVDNKHWPRPKTYYGDTNDPIHAFEAEQQPEGSPYVGIGTRHAEEQFLAALSAHVWIKGWIAAYYIDGYHRGLDVARLTGDYYIRRIFGEHGLTGRRLYLSIENLAELYDASKEPKYLNELNDRIDRLLILQQRQGGRMNIDRYGYSQNYLSHGLSKYLQMFDRPDIERAIVTHARSLVNVPPIDHDYESYFSTIHMLIVAYDLSGEDYFLNEAIKRGQHLYVDKIKKPFNSFKSQKILADKMEEVSHLPAAGEGPSMRGRKPIWAISQGMRVFGWTHAFVIPYLIDRMEEN